MGVVLLKALVACEESQAVANAFRARGHEAYSCDLKPCSGGHPEYHIVGEAVEVLNAEHWDLLIAHPPCTYLSNVSAPWLFHDRDVDDERYEKLSDARKLFMSFFRTDHADRVCIENPVPMKAAALPPYSQIIDPSNFGHSYTKKTCLWLRNLPPLMATEVVGGTRSWTEAHRSPAIRSKTFPGIAAAMADQWGCL